MAEMIPRRVSEVNRGTYDGVEYHVERLEHSSVNLSHLFVPPGERRQGKATAFLEALAENAEAAGLAYVVANVGGGDETARFFRRAGWEIYEQVGDSVTAELEL